MGVPRSGVQIGGPQPLAGRLVGRLPLPNSGLADTVSGAGVRGRRQTRPGACPREWLSSVKKSPPRQRPASFSIDPNLEEAEARRPLPRRGLLDAGQPFARAGPR